MLASSYRNCSRAFLTYRFCGPYRVFWKLISLFNHTGSDFILPFVHFKLALQISQAAPGFCILRNKINHVFLTFRFLVISQTSIPSQPLHCSRLKTFSIFTPVLQKPIHLCNHVCHSSQHLTLLYILSQRQHRPAPSIHNVGKSWISTAGALDFLPHSLPNSFVTPPLAFWLLLTVELQFSWKHPHSHWNLLPRLQWFFSPSPSPLLHGYHHQIAFLPCIFIRSSSNVFESAPNLSIIGEFHNQPS